jgi:predicted amidohydrolase YtcJ
MRWAAARLGEERLAGAYAWASFLRAGSRIAAGSDFPVERADPLLGFHAAVTRMNAQGEPAGGWRSHERLTREEALRAFTLDAAYAAFEEDLKGSLEAGKLADFVVLSHDIMTVEPERLLEARALMTVVGGKVVHLAW